MAAMAGLFSGRSAPGLALCFATSRALLMIGAWMLLWAMRRKNGSSFLFSRNASDLCVISSTWCASVSGSCFDDGFSQMNVSSKPCLSGSYGALSGGSLAVLRCHFPKLAVT